MRSLVLALQFYSGDEPLALRLAKLLTDIEPRPRSDVVLYFCTDAEQGPKLLEAQQYCSRRFPVGTFQSDRQVKGHPAGPNALWAATMQHLYGEWAAGNLPYESAFAFEPDGVPLRRDWIAQLQDAHVRTLEAGKLITADVKRRGVRHAHPNGNLIAHLSLVRDYPSVLETPPDQPWDMFHHVTLLRLCRPDSVIWSEHRSEGWTPEALRNRSRECAWLHGVRDVSGLRFARGLVEPSRDRMRA